MVWILRTIVALIGITALLQLFFRRRTPNYPTVESLITLPEVDVEAVRRTDGKIDIRWQNDLGAGAIYSGTSPDTIDHETPRKMFRAGETQVTLESIPTNARHFFEIASEKGILTVAERVLPLQSGVNFRDVGGYRTADGKRVQWGKVYRAGTLADLSVADQAYMEALGVKLVCDLRSDEEVSDEPDRLPDGVTYKHLPVRASDENARRRRRMLAVMLNPANLRLTMRDIYIRVMIDENAALIGEVLRQIADDDMLPMVVHCTAGKDRTGIVVAVLLTLLGVPEKTIVADYSLSNHYYEHFRTYAARNLKHFSFIGIGTDQVFPLLIADGSLLKETLAHIRTQYGSMERYLTTHAGVDADTIARVREVMLA